MGWKAIKNYYGITHHVAVYPEKGICIGSSYVHDLIMVDPVAKTLKPGTLGFNGYGDLFRYWVEMCDDRDKLWELADAEDRFEASLPVFTYENGAVLELFCEKRGYPNVTHDGRMMFENTFFEQRKDAIAYGKEDAEFAIKAYQRQVKELSDKLAEAEMRKSKEEANLASLEAM